MNLSQKISKRLLSYLKILPYKTLRLLDQFNNQLFVRYNPPELFLEQLKTIGCSSTSHMKRNLLDHFQGTYQLLKKWDNCEAVCLAGLFHAIYGTETFAVALVPLEKRKEIALLIGEEAEKLVYYYSIIQRKHFTNNLNNLENFRIKSRWHEELIEITELEFSQLLEIFLADRLEQIFDIHYGYRYEYKTFFLKAQSFFSQKAFKEFAIAYNI